MIWNVDVARQGWMTLVVRAASKERAHELAVKTVNLYLAVTDEDVSVEMLDPDGPDDVLVDSWA